MELTHRVAAAVADVTSAPARAATGRTEFARTLSELESYIAGQIRRREPIVERFRAGTVEQRYAKLRHAQAELDRIAAEARHASRAADHTRLANLAAELDRIGTSLRGTRWRAISMPAE